MEKICTLNELENQHLKLTDYQAIFYYEWFQDPMRNDYNIVTDIIVSGKMNMERFKRSTLQLINENLSFRSNVIAKGNNLYWRLRPQEKDVVTYHPNELTPNEIYDLISQPFDLEKDLLIRFHVIKLESEKYRIIYILHHIIIDGISTEEFYREWVKYYNISTYHKEITIEEQIILHGKLSDYFDTISQQYKESGQAFWQKRLAGVEGVDLAFLKKKNLFKETSQQRIISEFIFSIDAEILAQVNKLKRSHRITPYIFGQLVLGVLLHKISGQNQIGIAYPIALLEGKELFYGAHVNTLFIDYKFDETTTINTIIENTLSFFKEMKVSRAKYLPVHEIVGYALNTSILDVAFAQTFLRDTELDFEGFSLDKFNHEFQLDLVNTLLIEQEEYNNQLNYRVQYDANILEGELVYNFTLMYQKLFNEILEDLLVGSGEKAISEFGLLDKTQLDVILHDWNSTHKDYASEKTLMALFEEQVEKTPDAIAVVYKERHLTYRELNEESNRFAGYLKEQYAIRPDDLVTLCLDKSEQMLVTILAVLKVGGAYVPMDPDAPDERILYMMADTQTKLVITNQVYKARFDSIQTQLSHTVAIECIDSTSLKNSLQHYSVLNPISSVNSRNLAYVIYTSGTTGAPKGVMIEHRGVLNLATYQEQRMQSLCKGQEKVYERYLWFSNYIFDAHVLELYATILHGHCIYIIEEEKRRDYNLLHEYITNHKIEVAFLTPSILDKDFLLNLSVLQVGGEVTPLEVIEKYQEKGVVIINCYGPTEATTFVTEHEYEPEDSNIIIGRPISNSSLYVLDKNKDPLPIGAIGELYIGGDGVARGYLNNPALTEEKFVENPFRSLDEITSNYKAHLYRTGDLVRYLPDGKIEYLGRNDFQVKIRGFRIELGEIETRLATYPGIKQTLVLAKKNAIGIQYLVAYYVSEEVYSKEILSHYLDSFLPDYMIPAVFVQIVALPINANGKLDIKALPEPAFLDSEVYIAPENEIEEQLCLLYAEVLGIEVAAVGVEADFFRLGGDSISSIQLVSRLRQRLGIHLGVKDVFYAKTVRLLSEIIKKQKEVSAIRIDSEQGVLEGNAELLPIQKWFFHNLDQGLLPAYNHWNQTFMIEAPELDKVIFEQSVIKLIEQHDAFRLAYTKKDKKGEYKQFYQPHLAHIPIDYLNIEEVVEDERNSILKNWQSNFDIFSGRLFHIGLIEGYSDKRNRIHFAIHHLIIDAVSWRIIKEDLQTIYDYLYSHQDILPANIPVKLILGEKGSSYRQWTHHIEEYKHTAIAKKEIEYWNELTANVAEGNSKLLSIAAETHNQSNITLSKSQTEKLLRDIHQVYGTQINDVLLAALSLALTEWTGEVKHYIVLEGHGRESILPNMDPTNTIGWFTSMYPMVLNAEENSLGEVIASIKDDLNKIPNNGIAYGPLFGYTEKELPRISFNYLGQFDSKDKKEEHWTFSNENCGLAVAPANKDNTLININGAIIEGELQFVVAGSFPLQQLAQFTASYKQKLEAIIQELSTEKRQYLTTSTIDYIISKDYLNTIQRSKEIEGVYLANSLQQGFIYHALNQGEIDEAYRTQLFWEYHNPLDVDKMKAAWLLAQQKFASLRLRFSWEEELIQIIDKRGELDWHYIDLTLHSPDEQEFLYNELIKNDRLKLYDLAAGNLFRVYIVKRAETHYSCVFSSHHAILDGWSNPILIQYIHECYLRLLQNEKIHVNEDKSYALAQHYLQKNTIKEQKFWDDYLSKIDSNEDLSSLLKPEKRQVVLSDYKHIKEWEEHKVSITGIRYHKLKEFCVVHGFTMNALLQYCWHKQLNIYTASDTTIVGMIVSGRNLPIENIEESVGLYINTLPVVLEHTNEKVVDVITTLQKHINEVNSHSAVNLAKLQKEGNRLFNSLFVFENYPIPENISGNGLSVQFKGSKEKQDYPLSVVIHEDGDHILLNLQYAGELFDVAIVKQITEGILILLDQLIANNKIRTDEFTFLSQSEYQKITQEWNQTKRPYSSDKTSVYLFEEQVRKTPDAVAVIFKENVLTYAELNERANRLAHYLKENYDIRPDNLIALYLDRSEYMIISILAVLKAGGAYVPIDPQTPEARIVFMIEDSQVKVILTDENQKNNIEKLNLPSPSVSVDDVAFISALKTTYSSENTVTNTSANNLAYVIYSGTTGNPKGVMVEHHSINRLVENTASEYTLIDTQDNVLSLSSYQFDGSIYDIFGALLNGASLVIATQDVFLDLKSLNNLLEERKVTNFFVTSSLFNSMVDANLSGLKYLKYILVGGEALSLTHVKKFKKLFPAVNLVNGYGPTETTTFALSYLIEEGVKGLKTVPIGRPITNTSTYILDKNKQPLPVGAIGELYLGGDGVARGYLNNPELTAQQFSENIFRSSQDKKDGYNERIYKTGDLVRYLKDGTIKYIGRNDFQVKIRGFRIELGEIETRLATYPGIKQTAVLAKKHRSGAQYLVGYYVSEQEYDSTELHQYLESFLPEYMIPSAFVHLKVLQLTVNGKLDHRALPEPQLTGLSMYEKPQNETEQQLCQVYAEVLKLEVSEISVEDSFYQLGGNSILAIKLVHQINKELGKEIHISSIFNHKTIRLLSNYLTIAEKDTRKIEKREVLIAQEQLLSFAQERLWFIDSYEQGNRAYNIPIVYKLAAKTDHHILLEAIRGVVHRHEVLRSFIKTTSEGDGYQVVIDDKVQPLILHRQKVNSEEELQEAIRQTSNRLFKLEAEFPIYIKAYSWNQDTYLNIVIHHIAFDGWSSDIFIKELVALYEYQYAMQQGEKAIYPFSNKPLQYKEYALWQRDYLSGTVLDNQMTYWKEQLAGCETLHLPTDFLRPVYASYEGADLPFHLDANTSARLREVAQALDVSLYSLLLSGYYLLLSSLSNQKDIVIGTPIAGRHFKEVTDSIGFFVNTLALRQQVAYDQDLIDFIQQVNGSVHEAQVYQDIPFEKLVEKLEVKKDPSRHPVFQVLFGVQSFGKQNGTRLDSILEEYKNSESFYHPAKFDLTTMLDDSGACITGVFNYAIHLFKESTIENYSSVYKHILNQFIDLAKKENTIQFVKEIDYLDDSVYQKVLVDWNKTYSEYPSDKTITAMFEQQVEKTPDNIAVVYKEIRLTYRELNEQANRFASYLQTQYTIEPDDLVALCLDKSEKMLIAILGILKAGGAYVPMDTEAPEERMKFIVSDTKTKVVITNASYKEKWQKMLASTEIALECIDGIDFDRVLQKYAPVNLIASATSSNLAYVIYTSGTTGTPKGVMVEHKGVINLITWMNSQYPTSEQDKILQKTPYTFDVSIPELFWLNWYGGCVVFADPVSYKESVYLAEVIEKEKITIIYFVTSMLVAFEETIAENHQLEAKIQSLKYLICTGEALHLEEVREAHRLLPTCEIHNLYGPTEATVDVLYYDCNAKDLSQILIGRPISNTTTYVLNQNRQPVPIGAIGELYIGGDALARGYWNNEELTEGIFVKNPFQSENEKRKGYNNRIYKTGDLVRYLEDGTVEYLGRNDFQVKIRGFRIELGEIESRLAAYPGIKQVAVLAKNNASSSAYLVGYYVAEKAYDSQLLYNYLEAFLPEYMIPSVFVQLAVFPISVNGKLDRKALPEPQFTSKENYVAPQSETEKQLCQFYAEILQLDPHTISVEDNFYQLGGNSILAIKLFYKIVNTTETTIKIVDILSSKSIRDLGKKIESDKAYQPIIEFNVTEGKGTGKDERKDALFMIHPGMAGCEVYASLAHSLAPFYTCYGVDSYNLFNAEKIYNLSQLANYYLDHIDKISPKPSSYHLLGWSLGGRLALEIASKLEQRGETKIVVYLLDTWMIPSVKEDQTDARLQAIIDQYEVTQGEIEKIKEVVEVENVLSSQSISQPLRHTEILLFRATEDEYTEKLRHEYPLNNIDSCIHTLAQLKKMDVKSSHIEIIKQEHTIVEHILKNSKTL